MGVRMGGKPRITISSRQAAQHIKSGMSDPDLMRMYNVSARSLERLFEKLIEAGRITRAELEERTWFLRKSHVVDLVAIPLGTRRKRKEKIRISSREAVRSIRSGMTDTDLMEKYDLSARGLDGLFSKLVKAGKIDQADLDERKVAFKWAEIAFLKDEGSPAEPIEDSEAESEADSTSLRDMIERYRVHVAACLGAVGGMVFLSITFLMIAGWDNTRQALLGAKTPPQQEVPANSTLSDLADQMIGVLQSIARGDLPSNALASGAARSSAYERCLMDCDRQHSGSDEDERAMRVNCRMECVVRFSERMKKIRELYYGTPIRR